MTELGQLLSEARSTKQLSLADVEAGTRIRQKYLEALENGAYAELPRGPIARGFLRSYAIYLGLDAEEALRLYAQESGDSGDEVPVAESGLSRAVDYRPLEVELVDDRPSLGWLRWIVALLIVAALGAAGWWLLSRYSGGWRPVLAFWPAPSPTPTATEAATPWVVTATPPQAPPETPILATRTSDLLLLPTPTVPPTITPTPQATATPEIVAQIALTVTLNQRAWIRVVADDQVVQEGILEAGETRFWQAANSMLIRTGNAGGVNLTLNGEDLGPMGDIGQVVERSWVVEQGQVSETQPTTETPTAPPIETPAETSVATPADTPAPTPVETPAQAIETPAEAPTATAAPSQ